MYEYTKNLKAERRSAVDAMREILDRATNERRDLTGEEREQVDRIEARIRDYDEEIRGREKRAEHERVATEARAHVASIVQPATDGRARYDDDDLRAVLRGEAPAMEIPPMRVEARDFLTTSNAAGGYTVPTGFVKRLYEHLVEVSAIWKLNTTRITTSSGENMLVPKTAAYGTAAIVGEGTAIAESDPAFGQATLYSWKYGQLLQISNEMLADTAVDVEGFVARQASLALSNGYGPDFVSGTGTNEPDGIFHAAGTAVTFPTGGTGIPSADALIDMVHAISSPYRTIKCQWLTKDSNLAVIRKLKDQQDRYLWEPSLVPGQPDMLLGYEVVTDPNVAAFATAAGTNGIAFGNFSGYYVRDAGLRIEASRDYAFAQDLVTYRVVHRLDGRLIDTNAIKVGHSPTS